MYGTIGFAGNPVTIISKKGEVTMTFIRKTAAVFFIAGAALFSAGVVCAQKAEKPATEDHSPVRTVMSGKELELILANSGDDLLMFDLYADWCMPCRILSPMLEKIAREHPDKVTVYKINVDKAPDLAAAFGVSGIPFVVFVQNKTGVYALTGVQTEETYVQVINRFAPVHKTATAAPAPHGKLENGKRVIHLSTVTTPGNIYVYRGETVSIIIGDVNFPYSISIPEYKIMKDGVMGKDLEVTFKADKIGVYPIFCNGKCPAGDGSRYGQIIVMQYQPEKGKAQFAELAPDDAEKLIATGTPLILDVRTPNEYYGGHLKGARLIPLQQLEQRLDELASYKDKDILVYCHSGNRSTVASQILINNGFRKLHNLRQGIAGWEKAGKPVVKD